MNTAGADEVSEVLDRVKLWSPRSRITLAKRILETLDESAIGGAEREPSARTIAGGVTSELIVGLLRTDREPPDDEECRRIVEEERWKKYGS